MTQRCVFIRDWEVEVFTGVHLFEQGKKRRLRLTIEFYQDDAKAGVIEDVIDYSVHKKRMLEAMQARHYPLLEMIADVLTDAVFEDRLVKRVAIKIEKMDLYSDVESCGVSVDRTR